MGRLRGSLETLFPNDKWAVGLSVVEWTGENKKSLWENELQAEQRNWLEEQAGGRTEYALWLGSVHYLSVTVTSRQLFSEDAIRDNAGWRLSYLSLPAPRVFIVGLAHHYQQTPSQKKLADASNFLYDLLSTQLKSEDGPDLSSLGRKVVAADWDGTGLTGSNVRIGNGTWPGRLPLKMARNTTTKKILSTFITVSSITLDTSDSQLEEGARAYKRLVEQMIAAG